MVLRATKLRNYLGFGMLISTVFDKHLGYRSGEVPVTHQDLQVMNYIFKEPYTAAAPKHAEFLHAMVIEYQSELHVHVESSNSQRSS